MTKGQKKPIILGLAGGSGSGKSTIARLIAEKTKDLGVLHLALDHYYRDRSKLSPVERDQLNFDHPDALELDLLATHLSELAAGRATERPTYDFTTHCRAPGTARLEPCPLIIVDGIFAIYDANVRRLMNCCIFVDVRDDIRLLRRMKRDVAERGRTVDGVSKQYLATVCTMHEAYVEPCKKWADLVVDWNESRPHTIDLLVQLVTSLAQTKEN